VDLEKSPFDEQENSKLIDKPMDSLLINQGKSRSMEFLEKIMPILPEDFVYQKQHDEVSNFYDTWFHYIL